MDEINQIIKSASAATPLNISVIRSQNKAIYIKHPKMVQRLPREERAYWYWFLKNH